MGTEVHYKNLFSGYHSMRNVNEDSNSGSWHLFNTLTNGHYYDGYTPRTVTDVYFGHDKYELKQKMLRHEAVFKNQVYELHRLYRRQRDIMEEVKRKEFNKHPISIDTSSSSSVMPSQKPCEDVGRCQNPSFSLGNTTSRPSIFGAEMINSPLRSIGNGSKDCEVVECRPSKVRKKLFDLQLPGNVYIDQEEREHIVDNQTSEISSYPAKENGFVTKNGVKTKFDDGGKKDGYTNIASGQHSMRSNRLADLNEPVYGQGVDFPGPSTKPNRFTNLPFEGKSNGGDRFSACLHESAQMGQRVESHWKSSEMRKRPLNRFISKGNMGGNMNYTSQYFKRSTEFQHGGSYSEISSKIQDNSHLVFRDRWRRNGNGFYNGSSSGSKELPARLHLVGFDYQSCNKLDDGSQKIFKRSNFIDLTGATKDMDLNTVQNLSNEDNNSRKRDETVLPWLRAKPVICKNGNHSGDLSKERGDALTTNKKLQGFPIFGKFSVLKDEDSSAVSTNAPVKHRGIDINVTWDDMENQNDVKADAEIKNFKNHFDLNSCVTEDDDFLVMESVKNSKKTTMEIDLEAPAVSDIVEEVEHTETKLEAIHLQSSELEMIAAEVIIAISSRQTHVGPMSKAAKDNDNKDDPLLWFAGMIDSASHEMDEYEMLTLQLEETKEEDYMPKPFVPDFLEPDEVGPTVTSSRPRRGQARRGRPRRDFQRDVLPGMTSLSRHEITEDLQLFGGLMRATGLSYNVGSIRRNGKRLGAWGRRKVKAVGTTPPPSPLPPVHPPSSKYLNNVEVVGLDERSLRGWGKTTRRPRRQRCPAGNSVAVQLA